MRKEISAEMLLNFLYPERMEKWTVESKGTFYRNYNQDTMDVDLQQNSVQVARDGLMRLLPEYIFTNDKSRLEETREQEQWRLMLVNAAFMPFDSFAFRYNLKLEHETSTVLREGWDYMLNNVFGYFQTDTAHREVAGILPLIRNRKGDLQFIQALLATLFQCKVVMDKSHRYSHSESTRRWIPMVRYELLIPDLTVENYREQYKKLQHLKDFVQEWLMPFDVKLEIAIKHHGCDQMPGENLILDYNSEL